VDFKFPPSIYTPDQVQFGIDELRTYAEVLVKQNRLKKREGLPVLSSGTQDLLATLPATKRQDAAAVEEFSTALEKLLTQAPVVNISLAAAASHTVHEEIVAWLRQNISAGVLVAFHVNPDIAGGMVVRTTNKVFDFSWRNLLLDHPERLVKAIESV
jgi:hypothetical protein